MSGGIVLQQSPDAVALGARRGELAGVRARLAEREGEVALLRARMKVFEGRYVRQVGVLYAELDELEARIAEREIALYDSEAARRRAEEARQRARETREAAFGDVDEVLEFDPPVSLKTLFREVAKRIHPDFARDEAEGKHFTLLMARANQAYRRGDFSTLERLLDDQREVTEGDAAEMVRVVRQIRHAERDLAALEGEVEALMASEIGQMFVEAERAAGEYRDLLAELASGLREQVADAERRFELIDRQIRAHGR